MGLAEIGRLWRRVMLRKTAQQDLFELIETIKGLDEFEYPDAVREIAGTGKRLGSSKDRRIPVVKKYDTQDVRVMAQVAAEIEAYDKAVAEHQSLTVKEHGKYEGYNLARQKLMRRHFTDLLQSIADDLKPSRGQPTLVRARFGMLAPEYIAVTALNYAMAAAEAGLRQQKAAIDICHALDRQRAVQRLSEKYSAMFEDAVEGKGWSRGMREYNLKWQLSEIMKEDEEFAKADFERVKAGNQILFHVIASTGLIELETRDRANFVKFGAKAHDEYLAIKARAEYFVMPQLQPLTVRPLDWSSLNDGGYYVHVHNAINVDPITAWKRKYRTRFREAPPKQALEAINHLQGTAYVVNEDVRRMMSRLLRGRSRTTLVVPEDLSAAEETPIDTSDEVDASDEDDNQLAKLAHVVAKNLTQARLFAARGQPFYYTWKMDFRGRAYPIARTLGPQGHDSAHAILKFADERPLTADGEKWLALHGFNVLGAKIKEDTLARRLEWIEDHGRQIEDAASLEPSTLEFWSGSTGDMAKFRKTAWRALAFCDAWKKCRSGERATGLPVAIDGTCNAIQHLAALTGDEKMAFETNMTGETRRQDIYGEVAEELRRKLQDDRNSEDYARFAAMMTELGVTDPLSVINRSLCKQPVMTKPYGASSEASWKAINAEFSARYGGKGSKLEGIGERFKVSGYLVRKLSESVEIILKPATGLMGWLQTAAVRIAELNVPVAWRTPLGLEVEQSYAVYTGESIQTPLKRFNMGRNSSDLTMQIPTDALDRDKTKSAIVANFVHSLDATHMMMTTLAAKRAGITSLRLVHDSFGVHANDMEVFSKLVREEFVNLYRRHDPVQEFKDYCDAILIKNGKSPLDAPPPRGKFDVTHVLQAAYFFS